MHALTIEDGMETIRQTIATTKAMYHLQKFGITGYAWVAHLPARCL